MAYDSELTGRLARSKRELERLFKFLSKNLSTCGWKIMSSEPRQSPALCEFDTICSLKRNPRILITRKEKAEQTTIIHSEHCYVLGTGDKTEANRRGECRASRSLPAGGGSCQ